MSTFTTAQTAELGKALQALSEAMYLGNVAALEDAVVISTTILTEIQEGKLNIGGSADKILKKITGIQVPAEGLNLVMGELDRLEDAILQVRAALQAAGRDPGQPLDG